MGERAFQLRPHGGAELGQARPRLAVKQRRAEFALEQANAVGQRRLRDAAAPGGAREVQLLAQREKIDDLPDFHAPPPVVAASRGRGGPLRRSAGARWSWCETIAVAPAPLLRTDSRS